MKTSNAKLFEKRIKEKREQLIEEADLFHIEHFGNNKYKLTGNNGMIMPNKSFSISLLKLFGILSLIIIILIVSLLYFNNNQTLRQPIVHNNYINQYPTLNGRDDCIRVSSNDTFTIVCGEEFRQQWTKQQ